VSKAHGGDAAAKHIAYAWAVSVAPEDAGPLLRRLGLAEAAVDAAVEAGAFGHAFQLAQAAAPGRLCEVHVKHAMFLEDGGRFAEAEAEFVKAGEAGAGGVRLRALVSLLTFAKVRACTRVG
jgi:intraflagellar transport protein 172